MAYGVLFVLSEALDFAVENPLYISLVALVSFYLGLEGKHAVIVNKRTLLLTSF